MEASERDAIKRLIDKATRAKLQAQARHGARLHGRIEQGLNRPAIAVASLPVRRGFRGVHDESYDTARAVNLGISLAQASGSALPSERMLGRSRGRAA